MKRFLKTIKFLFWSIIYSGDYKVKEQSKTLLLDVLGEKKINPRYKLREKISTFSNLILFDTTIATMSQGRLWFGDLNLEKNRDRLQMLSSLLKEDLYLFNETKLRYNEDLEDIEELLQYTDHIIVNPNTICSS